MPGRTSLKKGQTQTSKEEGGSTTRTTAQIEKYYSGGKRPFSYKKNDRGKIVKIPQMLTGGQAAIAAKAPPPNKIDAKDFAVLRAEKAKGRGMGLQDESKKPGKIYKAKRGMSFSDKMKAVEDGKINKKTGKPTSMAAMREMKGFKPGESASEFMKRRKELGAAGKALSATRIGKIALGVGAAGVAAQQYLKGKKKKDKNKKTLKDFREQKKPGVPSEKTKTINSALNKLKAKKMGGGMMQRPMGYSKGSKKPMGYMGGGMMQKPMGYTKGTMVKARGCKLGRTKPTKIT